MSERFTSLIQRAMPAAGCLCLLLLVTGFVRAEPVGRVQIDALGGENVTPDRSIRGDAAKPILIESDDLPPLADELDRTGGSYLYEPLRPPELFGGDDEHPVQAAAAVTVADDELIAPPPLYSWPGEYLGANTPVSPSPLRWFGELPYAWQPTFLVHGRYELFGIALEENDRRFDAVGQQVFIDLDLALTGTERVHVQFRPLGEDNSGGSYWRLDEPNEYVDNSAVAPQLWWLEAELESLLGGRLGDAPRFRDVNFVIGRFPLALHNGLLITDEVVGVIVAKNSITWTPLSQANVQFFYALDEIDKPTLTDNLIGMHLSGDFRHAFLELTYAWRTDSRDSDLSSHFVAGSATQFFGPYSVAGRLMGRTSADDSGALAVFESNWTRKPTGLFVEHADIERAVTYFNAFYATEHWRPIAGGGFDRLRSVFTANPLVQLAAGRRDAETSGAAVGVQLFRDHEDESITPEFAVEAPGGRAAGGVSLRYLRKLTSRSYLELLGIKTWSNWDELERAGVFLSTFIIF